MDGVQKLTNLQKYYPNLNLAITLYPDPIFQKFTENPFILTGENLILTVSKIDNRYHILIKCHEILIQCSYGAILIK